MEMSSSARFARIPSAYCWRNGREAVLARQRKTLGVGDSRLSARWRASELEEHGIGRPWVQMGYEPSGSQIDGPSRSVSGSDNPGQDLIRRAQAEELGQLR